MRDREIEEALLEIDRSKIIYQGVARIGWVSFGKGVAIPEYP